MAWNLSWTVAVALAAGVGLAGAALVAPGAGKGLPLGFAASKAPEPLLTQAGDTVLLHVAFYDNEGRLLLSTREGDRPRMEETRGTFPGFYALPPTVDDSPQRHTLRDGREPLPVDDRAVLALGQQLLGKPVGHVVAAPVVGRMHGYDQTTVLERTRGPFNRTLPLGTATLDKLAGGQDRFALDNLFEAVVVERGERVSWVRLEVEDGQALAIRNAGFRAVVDLDETGERFQLRLDADVGHQFSLNENCEFARYVLPLGSYRVTAVDEEAITLLSSPTKWPQLIDRDLAMVLEIVDIQRP